VSQLKPGRTPFEHGFRVLEQRQPFVSTVAQGLTQPNLCVEIDEQIVEDDLVAMRWRLTSRSSEPVATDGGQRC
jgi:hypothetical protein